MIKFWKLCLLYFISFSNIARFKESEGGKRAREKALLVFITKKIGDKIKMADLCHLYTVLNPKNRRKIFQK